MGNKKSPFRHAWNRILHLIAQFGPGCTTIRPLLHKMRGVKITGHVFIGDQAYLENEYPECIDIHDGVQVGLRTVIMAHFRGAGKVVIGKNVWIGPNCVIAAHNGMTLVIGEGSMIGASCVITKDVPPGSMMLGAKATRVAELSIPMTLETSYEDFKKGVTSLRQKEGA